MSQVVSLSVPGSVTEITLSVKSIPKPLLWQWQMKWWMNMDEFPSGESYSLGSNAQLGSLSCGKGSQ